MMTRNESLLAQGAAMKQDKGEEVHGKSILSYFNLSSHYERKARLLPGLLCAMTFLPVGTAFGTPLGDWLGLVATGIGLWAVMRGRHSPIFVRGGEPLAGEALAPLAVTTRRRTSGSIRGQPAVRPSRSSGMYEAIKRLTRLDIEAAVNRDRGGRGRHQRLRGRLRHRLRNSPHADRLDDHNADYGFARNFAGLRPSG